MSRRIFEIGLGVFLAGLALGGMYFGVRAWQDSRPEPAEFYDGL